VIAVRRAEPPRTLRAVFDRDFCAQRRDDGRHRYRDGAMVRIASGATGVKTVLLDVRAAIQKETLPNGVPLVVT